MGLASWASRCRRRRCRNIWFGHRRPPSQAWRTFLKNHAPDLIALDFFTVPTATFRVLFVVVMLTHSRRRLAHFNVTEHPSAEWTARQLLEASALEEGLRYLIRDRDQVRWRASHLSSQPATNLYCCLCKSAPSGPRRVAVTTVFIDRQSS